MSHDDDELPLNTLLGAPLRRLRPLDIEEGENDGTIANPTGSPAGVDDVTSSIFEALRDSTNEDVARDLRRLRWIGQGIFTEMEELEQIAKS